MRGSTRWEVVDDGRRPDKDQLVAEVVDGVLKRAQEECGDLLMTRAELTTSLSKLSIAVLYCLAFAISNPKPEE